MTLIEVELAVLVAVVIVAAVQLWRASALLVDRLYDRQVAMDKQAKEIRRDSVRVAGDAERALERVEHLHEDARLLHQRVDQHFRERVG